MSVDENNVTKNKVNIIMQDNNINKDYKMNIVENKKIIK